MASWNKFNIFRLDCFNKVHNLGADVIKIMLTNSAPVATNAVKADITEISAANGYSAGGATIASTATSQASGTARLIGNAVTITASGGTVGPFRYAVVYNSTPANGNLIGWWDYGAAVTLNDGESIKIGKDTSGNNWDTGTPILSDS